MELGEFGTKLSKFMLSWLPIFFFQQLNRKRPALLQAYFSLLNEDEKLLVRTFFNDPSYIDRHIKITSKPCLFHVK